MRPQAERTQPANRSARREVDRPESPWLWGDHAQGCVTCFAGRRQNRVRHQFRLAVPEGPVRVVVRSGAPHRAFRHRGCSASS